jgi:hypothetical protein
VVRETGSGVSVPELLRDIVPTRPT